MITQRASLIRSLASARTVRPVARTLARRNLQPALRRGYASGGDAHAAAGSDLPWLLGAIGVTVPGCWYLWPEAAHGDAHHGHGEHEGHEEAHEESEDGKEGGEEEGDEAPKEEADSDKSADGGSDDGDKSKGGEDKADKSEEKAEKSEDKSDGSEDKSDDQGEKEEKKASAPEGQAEKTSNKKVDGVQFKGKTSAGDDNNEMHDYRKRESDSKGAFKKRIDSAYQKNLGEGDHVDEEGNPTRSGATATKPSGNSGLIDSKQAGISSTPTRHSTQIDQDPEKSKKANGTPETAKSSTTIDPEMGKKKSG